MITQTPNNSFDDGTRHVDVKLVIHFGQAPLTVYSSDYLVDINVIEETAGESKNPLGAVTANELMFTLNNESNIFNPSNVNSPYYDQIKVGVKVEAFICCSMSHLEINAATDVGITWISLGKFAVSSWIAKSGDKLIIATATDNMQRILSKPLPKLNTLTNTTFAALITAIFSKLDVTQYHIGAGLSTINIPYVPFYNDDTVPSLLQRFSEASMCAIYADREGTPVVRPIVYGDADFVLTDDNQIISVDIQQSILKNYNGVELTYYKYQVSDTKELLNIKNAKIPMGVYVHGPFIFSAPLYTVGGITIEAKEERYVEIEGYNVCSYDAQITTSNEGEEIPVETGVYERYLGTKSDNVDFKRSGVFITYTPGGIHNIHTGVNSRDKKLVILFYDSDKNFLHYEEQPIASNGVCSLTTPAQVTKRDVQVHLGSAAEPESLIKHTHINPKPGEVFDITPEGFTLKTSPSNLTSSSVLRPLLVAGVPYAYSYDCEVLEDVSTNEGYTASRIMSGLYMYGGSGGDVNLGASQSHKKQGAKWHEEGQVTFSQAFIAANSARLYGYSERWQDAEGNRHLNTLRISNFKFYRTDQVSTETENYTDSIPCVEGTVYSIDTKKPSNVGNRLKVTFTDAANNTVGTVEAVIDENGTTSVTAPATAVAFTCTALSSILAENSFITVTGPSTTVPAYFTFYGENSVLTDNVNLTTFALDGGIEADIYVYGRGIEQKQLCVKDNVSNPLKVDNTLIQDDSEAIRFKDKLTKFIKATIPELTLIIRGNPLMETGDIIEVHSATYNVHFKGILKRAEYDFKGFLTCKITLLNVEVLL